MNIKHRPLYATRSTSVPMRIKLALVMIAACAPLGVMSGSRSYEQEFLITGYYSPTSGQCCYVKGGEYADKILNGQGHTAADGTAVYPGMIAAPPSYPFGTRIHLHGIGVFEVNDRGGAIQELSDGVHRLDIWTGAGEEGLARALGIGLRDIKGTVYPPGSDAPPVDFSLDSLPAPVEKLRQYLVRGDNLMSMKAKLGQRGLSVSILQDHLREAGYLSRGSSGFFGPETHEALAAFIRDFHVEDTAEELTPKSAAHLIAMVRRGDPGNPISGQVSEESSPKQIMEAKRILRFFGYYDGRTDGRYDDALFAAILSFQRDHGLVGDAESPGAGRIGPLTMRALKDKWTRHLIARRAHRYLAYNEVGERLQGDGRLPDSFMGSGYHGSHVRLLQLLLSERGFFPSDEINGNYGPLTEESVLKYQLSRGIVSSASDPGAGYVGPATLSRLRKEEQGKYYDMVRAEGWHVL